MEKLCEFCGEYPARHLEPVENGPVHSLTLEEHDLTGKSIGSDDYCSTSVGRMTLK
jgi:hypothetical protein